MNIFISGGCKNGKSYYAQKLARDMAAKAGLPLYYLATMIPKDGEDRARIKRHLSERDGWGFDTIEQGTDICKCLSGGKTLSGKAVDSRGVFLLDSVTALLSNEMFLSDGTFVPDAPAKVAGDLTDSAGLPETRFLFPTTYIQTLRLMMSLLKATGAAWRS